MVDNEGDQLVAELKRAFAGDAKAQKDAPKEPLRIVHVPEPNWTDAEMLVDGAQTRRRSRLLVVTDAKCETALYAMLAHEYCCALPDRVMLASYIEKIDSTGASRTGGRRPASAAGALVCGYVRFVGASVALAREAVTALGKSNGGGPVKVERAVHVFARPQPEYLFPGSERDNVKTVLDDRALVSWWGRTLGRATANVTNVKLYCLLPGEDAAGAQSVLRAFGAEKWQSGLPYPPAAIAATCVPFFPDDAKSRVLRQLIGPPARRNRDTASRTTVRDLAVYLDAAAEFRETRGGIFVVGFPSVEVPVGSSGGGICEVAKSCFERALAALERGCFATDAGNRAAARVLVEAAGPAAQFAVELSGRVTLPLAGAPVVNAIQSLVRKRPASSTLPAVSSSKRPTQ